MLTEEQIKNLKPGDPLIIHGEYIKHLCDGDIVIKCNITRGGEQTTDRKYFHPSCVSLPSEHGTSLSRRSSAGAETEVPTPKYPPTRLFKKGDKVKRRTVDGRTDPDVSEGINLTVTSDEDSHGNVHVKEPWGRSIVTKSVFLELVTPVEEAEPFYVDYITTDDDDDLDDNPRWCVKYRKYDDIVSVFYRNGFEPSEKTRAAAEAECDRLNAEYR